MKIKGKVIAADFEENTLTIELPQDVWKENSIFGGDNCTIIDCPLIQPDGATKEDVDREDKINKELAG